ncbi:unnamed protein product [Ilex paraguariensis]|uniref:Uncharacterized protein n=1 Tax=Ilex paraguariensis TaxID=185542 RepID=A0ABC8TSW0_9AQUA
MSIEEGEDGSVPIALEKTGVVPGKESPAAMFRVHGRKGLGTRVSGVKVLPSAATKRWSKRDASTMHSTQDRRASLPGRADSTRAKQDRACSTSVRSEQKRQAAGLCGHLGTIRRCCCKLGGCG